MEIRDIFVVEAGEHPPHPHSGKYLTPNGEVEYSADLRSWINTDKSPRLWLRKINLPTPLELRKMSLGKFTEEQAKDPEFGDFIEDDAKEFMRGAEFILNRLQQI